MIIYVDNSHKCHTSNDGTMREIETDFFDGKCAEFIEGYKYDDSLGYVQIYPWKPYADLEKVQGAVERTQAEADEQISVLLDTIENLILEV